MEAQGRQLHYLFKVTGKPGPGRRIPQCGIGAQDFAAVGSEEARSVFVRTDLRLGPGPCSLPLSFQAGTQGLEILLVPFVKIQQYSA